MIEFWQTLLATPMWLKLVVVLLVGLAAAFPPVLAFLLRTEAGRALLLGLAAIVVICWFRASAFTAGRAAERAVWEARIVEQAMQASRQTIRAAQLSAEASTEARRAGAARADSINDSRRRAEGIAREPRKPGPDGCPPVADPRLVRESREAAERIAATEDRLRGL